MIHKDIPNTYLTHKTDISKYVAKTERFQVAS